MIYFTVIQLWIFCFGIAATLPLPISSGQEIHKFRWTTSSDLNNTLCAYGVDLAWYWVDPWRPNHFLERVFFSTFFSRNMAV
jgi:hypothetical protein